MIAGILCLPFIYLIGAFSTDNASGVQSLLVVFALLFYVQLIVQSIVATISLKHIESQKQYLASVLFILLPPLILLPTGLIVGMSLTSNLVIQISLAGTLILQMLGSVWMWVVIGMRSKRPLEVIEDSPAIDRQSPSSASQSFAGSQETVTIPISSQKAAPIISRRSNKKIGTIILLAPVILFILSMILLTVTVKINPEYFTSSIARSFPLGRIAEAMATLSGVLFAPCVVTGIVLLTRK